MWLREDGEHDFIILNSYIVFFFNYVGFVAFIPPMILPQSL